MNVYDSGESFRFGWKFVNHRNNITEENGVIIDEESVITQPYTTRHIYHFTESINFFWTKLMFINKFPVVCFLPSLLLDSTAVAAHLRQQNRLSMGNGLCAGFARCFRIRLRLAGIRSSNDPVFVGCSSQEKTLLPQSRTDRDDR